MNAIPAIRLASPVGRITDDTAAEALSIFTDKVKSVLSANPIIAALAEVDESFLTCLTDAVVHYDYTGNRLYS